MNELNINLKVNSDGSATIQQVTGGLGGLRQEAGNTGTALTRFSADAQSVGDGVRRALEFAGVTLGLAALAYKVKEFTAEVMDLGARTEMLKGAAYAVGQYYQVSGQAIDYYVGKLREGGISEQNAFYGVTKFLSGGLNLELIPALAAAAKNLAPLAPEAKTVNEEFKGLVTTISSGMPRGLKEYGVQMANVLGDAGRSVKELDQEMSLTGPERAKATLDFVLAFSEKVKYVGEETANAYARQTTKTKLEAERAKEALFEIFKPIGEAITGEKFQAWQDINGIIARNKTELIKAAEAVGVYVGNIADGVKSVMVFAGTHKELFGVLLEIYGIYKVVSWITPYIAATTAATTANAALAAAQTTAAATSALAATAQTAAGVAAAGAAPQVLYLANAYGAVTGTATLAAPAVTGAGAAAATSGTMATAAIAGWTGLAGAIKLAVIALAAYGAYKTFKEPGQLTGPTASGDPLADVAAGARDKDLTPKRGPLTIPSPLQRFQEFSAAEIKKQIDGAQKIAEDEAKKNQPKFGKGGGAGGDTGERGLENFIARMNQETARGSGEGMAQLDAWKAKEIKDLEQIAAKGVDVSEGKKALDAAYYSKKGKLDEDFNLLVAKESVDAFAEIDATYRKDLTRFGDTEEKKAQLKDIRDRKTLVQEIKNDDERLSRQKDYLGQLAGYAPLLSQQLALQQDILGIEQEQAKNKLYLDYWTGKITLDEWKGLEALRAKTAEMALQAQERKKWEIQGVGGGVKLFAYDLQKESETAIAFGVRDGLKGAKDFADKGITDLIMSPFTKKKLDFKKIGLDAATSFVSGFVKIGTTKLFSAVTEGALGMADTWKTAQQTMTAASLAGDAARTASVASGAGESISIFGALAKGNILMEAGRAGAAGFTSVMEAVPFPLNIVLAPLTAAAAFAATLAFGSGIGGGNVGGWTPGQGTGGVVAHQGWLVAHRGLDLAADERHVIAQVGEGILQNRAMDKWARAGVGFDLLNDPERLPVLPGPVRAGSPAPASGGGVTIGDIHLHVYESEMTPQKAQFLVRRYFLPELQMALGRYGK